MNYRMVKNVLGWLLLFEACFMLLPVLTAIVYGEWNELFAFLYTIALLAAVGTLLVTVLRPKKKEFYAKEGFIIVSLGWILISLFGALPFVFSGVLPSYIDALFETVSGFSTTGASIFTDVESLPRTIIMWRSFTHWVGGMGVLVFIMAFLPLSGGRNMHIMKAESPGPSVSKLVPRVRTTALILYLIYTIFTLLEMVLLLFGGMTFFEALNTAFATAGTGGFGFRNDSYAGFSSYVHIVIAAFMLLFSVNFSSYYLLWRRKWKDALNSEFRWFVAIVVTAVALITVEVFYNGYYVSVGESIKHSLFSVATVISTTGFTSTNFDLWPSLSKSILVILMFVGACAGSTGGGIKVSRLMIFFKTVAKEMGAMLHPKQVKKSTMDGRPVESSVVKNVCAYMAAYVLIFVVSILLISVDGKDLVTNFTAVTASFNNIGVGLSEIGPAGSWAGFSVFSKLVLCLDMLIGRLEIFPMLLLFSPRTWKK